MDGHDLKAWRKRRGITQAQAAKLVAHDVQTWGRWERNVTPIPESIVAYCSANAAPLADDNAAPLSEAELIAQALRLADTYIEGMRGIPSKFGRDTPYRWAVSYWFDGAMVAPLVHYGHRGKTPCPAAYKAAIARLTSTFHDGHLYRILAELDDCPAYIKAAA